MSKGNKRLITKPNHSSAGNMLVMGSFNKHLRQLEESGVVLNKPSVLLQEAASGTFNFKKWGEWFAHWIWTVGRGEKEIVEKLNGLFVNFLTEQVLKQLVNHDLSVITDVKNVLTRDMAIDMLAPTPTGTAPVSPRAVE